MSAIFRTPISRGTSTLKRLIFSVWLLWTNRRIQPSVSPVNIEANHFSTQAGEKFAIDSNYRWIDYFQHQIKRSMRNRRKSFFELTATLTVPSAQIRLLQLIIPINSRWRPFGACDLHILASAFMIPLTSALKAFCNIFLIIAFNWIHLDKLHRSGFWGSCICVCGILVNFIISHSEFGLNEFQCNWCYCRDPIRKAIKI